MNKIRYWKRPYATQLGVKTAKTKNFKGVKSEVTQLRILQ